jgi:hypothetical protein
MKTAIELIAQERARQLTAEGYTYAHDDAHTHGHLAAAAVCYIDAALCRITYNYKQDQDEEIAYVMMQRWPWKEEEFKPHADPIRNLVKAGALIAAEIERLQRLQK